MKRLKLRFVADTNMFGTNIRLVSDDGTYDRLIVDGFNPSNPLEKMDPTVTKGYLFRSPHIREEVWPSTLGSLCNIDGRFNLLAELAVDDSGRESVTAWARFEERDDAALFGWSQLEDWQKWSDEKEAEFSKRLDESEDRPRIEIGDDGKIRATVKVETLGD